jgi:hypothetical protein
VTVRKAALTRHESAAGLDVRQVATPCAPRVRPNIRGSTAREQPKGQAIDNVLPVQRLPKVPEWTWTKRYDIIGKASERITDDKRWAMVEHVERVAPDHWTSFLRRHDTELLEYDLTMMESRYRSFASEEGPAQRRQ